MILLDAGVTVDWFEEGACWKNGKLRWEALVEESEVQSSWKALGQNLPNSIHQFCEK